MRQLNKNKKEIVSAIMNSQEVLKVIYYTNNSVSPFEQANLTSSQKKKIKSENIYEYRKIPTSDSDEQKTYISMEYGIINYNNRNQPYFNIPEFVFYIISHSSLDDNKIIGSRVNEIENILIEILHNKFELDTLGVCRVVSSGRINLSNDFIGREIHLTFSNFTHSGN